jgi:alkanesulfonate monooxygenase SsuD/methylene tetrahydromethanopterin reductase-like flavin-dependent oxidoreductase (luciferase family)
MAVHSPLMIAHQWACLDYASNGRAILGVGLGRGRRCASSRCREVGSRASARVAVIRSLWSNGRRPFSATLKTADVAEASAAADADLDGVGHPNAVRRAARLSMVGWAQVARASLRFLGQSRSCGRRWRRPAAISKFPHFKRVFTAVDEA